MGKEEDLKIVEKYQKEIVLLYRAFGLLIWDQKTYMPRKATKSRAEKNALLESLIHEKIVSDELFNSVLRLEKEELDERTRGMIRRLGKDVKKAKKLPKEFVEELSKATSLGSSKWEEAKKKSDFEIFRPYLEKIVELKRREAQYIGLSGHLYNSLMDDFEEGMTVEKLKPIFKELKGELLKLLKKIESSEVYKNQEKDDYNFNENEQLEITKEIIERMGLLKDYFRMDVSEHPFTIGFSPFDVRITINTKKDLKEVFSSGMHEGGHALYNLNMPREEEFSFLYDSPSFGMHEAQSRFWENMIGKGKQFQKYFFPKVKERFNLKDFERWYRNLNLVEPGKIRISSDEVHYCLHIILRFELELGLIEGSIEVKDLPKLWNKKMKEYFGVEIENDSEGVLQDVHWSDGAFGYFPSYAIGTVYSVQLYNQLKKEIPDIEEDIKKGDFEKTKEWLKEKIHKHGAKYSAEDLMKSVCGEGLNPDVFVNYLNEKYGEIYNIR